ncbi:MAG: diguanylate cyclase [Variovorax sp.]
MLVNVEEEYEALIQFLYIAPIGLAQARSDGEIVMINPLCAQLLLPLSVNGGLTNIFTALQGVAPDLKYIAQRFDQTHGMVCEGMHLQVSAGRTGHEDAQILALSLLKLDHERFMVVLGDVTQSVKRDRALRQSQAWIHTIVTELTDYALVSLDARGNCQTWNPGIGRVTGFESAATNGHSYSLFYPTDNLSDDRAMDRLREADRSGWSLDEGWRARADGSRYWGSCLIAPFEPLDESSSEERSYSLIIRDISDRREAAEAVRRSVSCDHLTGLANRRVLFEAAENEMQRWTQTHRPLSIVLIDADHFKKVNDLHGHAAGDSVLRHLADEMSATFHSSAVVARLGGEEFVVLLPGTTLAEAESLASNLCRTIQSQSVEVANAQIRYTISAGVAGMDQDVEGVDALIKRADAAMYSAKAHGRNRVERWSAGLRGATRQPETV